MRIKLFSIFLLLFFLGSLTAQDIDREDPTYMRVNHEYIAPLINWQGIDTLNHVATNGRWHGIVFDFNPIPDSAGLFPIHFEPKKFKPRLSKSVKKHPIFFLDTTNFHDNRSYYYYANPFYFDSLYWADALHLENGNQMVGIISETAADKINPTDLFSILSYMGVVNTYYHLYAELITTHQEETDEFFEVHYFVQWHICTSRCDDPIYEFGMRLDKQTREVSAFYLE